MGTWWLSVEGWNVRMKRMPSAGDVLRAKRFVDHTLERFELDRFVAGGFGGLDSRSTFAFRPSMDRSCDVRQRAGITLMMTPSA